MEIKSFCLNLEDSENKYNGVVKELKKINIYPERFVAKKHKIVNRITRSTSEKANQILESHLSLFRYLQNLKDEIFLIIEDDVVVFNEFDISDVINMAPDDWNVIFLGGVNHESRNQPILIDDIFHRCQFAMNLHAFLIKRDFIQTVIDRWEIRDSECDVMFADLQKSYNFYGLNKDSIIQNGLESITVVSCLPEMYLDLYKFYKNKKVILSKIEAKKVEFYRKNKKQIFENLCSKLLKYLPNEYPKINKNSKNKTVIVESRFNDVVEFAIKNTIQKMGDDWGHILVCTNNNFEQFSKLRDEINDDIKIVNL